MPDPPPTPRPAVPDAQASCKDLADFLAGWFRTWQAARLYDAQHPVLRDASAQAARALTGLPGTLSVVILPEGFEWYGEAVVSDTAPGPLTTLANTLHGLDISAINLNPGLTAADAEAAALALAMDDAAGQMLVDRVNQATSGRLGLRAVSYRSMQMRDVTRDTDQAVRVDDPAARARRWARLNTGILNLVSESGDPHALAQQIGAEVLADPGAALPGLQKSLVGAARTLASRSREEQEDGLQNLTKLLHELGPQLRTSLEELATSPPVQRNRNQKAHAAADDTTKANIGHALVRSEKTGTQLSPEAVMLCQKLADFEHAPALAQDNDDEPNPAAVLADALESLFSRFDTDEFTPDDYRAQIQRSLNAPTPTHHWPNLTQDFAPDTVAVRRAHIAHDLLTDDDEPSAALQDVIAASVVPLIEARSFGVLSERLRRGDTTLAQALTRDTAIDRVLEADAQDVTGQHQAVIAGLLHHAGERGIQRAAHRMVHAPPDTGDRLGPAAQAQIDTASPDLRGRALQHALVDATGSLPANVAPLLAGLAFHTATDLLKTRLNASHASERHAAYRLLIIAFPEWPARFLSQTLRDRDPEVQRCVLDQLCLGETDEALTLTQITLEGDSPAGLLPPNTFDRLVRGTLARGVAGEQVAARALKTLTRTLSPRRAARGTQLARALADHRDNPQVRRARRLWQLTPTRWAACLAATPAPPPPESNAA